MVYVITLSFLIVAVLLIRAIFRKSVSPVSIYALWIVVALKLVMPFSLFAVPLDEFLFSHNEGEQPDGKGSAETYNETNPYWNENSGSEIFKGGFDTQNYDVAVSPEAPVIKPNSNDYTENKVSSEASQNDDSKVLIDKRVTKENIDFSKLINGVQIAGSLMLAAFFITTGTIFSIKLHRDRKLVGRYRGIKVYVSKSAAMPCIHGIVPAIYLTPKAYTASGRWLIVKHEYTHFCHGDIFWSVLRMAAIIIHWWNPLVWAAAIISKQDAELACDHSVTKRMDTGARIGYARIIVDMLDRKPSFATGFIGGSIKERVIMMTKTNKTKLMSAILALLMVIFSLGCSFVTFSEKEGANEIDKTVDTLGQQDTDLNQNGDDELNYENYLRIIRNYANFDIKPIVFKSNSIDYTPVNLANDICLFRIDNRSINGTVDLFIADRKTGKTLGYKTIVSEEYPSQVMYTDDGVILYNFYYDTELEAPVVQCAFDVGYHEGKLSCEKLEDFEVNPCRESKIESPDGSTVVYRTRDDLIGHGGIDIYYSDGRIERIAENVMLDDKIGNRIAGLADVRGYTPVAFLDNDRFIYRIGGWEWSCGYGIYNIATGEKQETEDGRGLQQIDSEGNLYVSEVSNYEDQNIWKISKEGTELIASMDGDPEKGIFDLSEGGVFYQGGCAFVVSSELGENVVKVCTPDLKKDLAIFEVVIENAYVSYEICDDVISIVVFIKNTNYAKGETQ